MKKPLDGDGLVGSGGARGGSLFKVGLYHHPKKLGVGTVNIGKKRQQSRLVRKFCRKRSSEAFLGVVHIGLPCTVRIALCLGGKGILRYFE